MLWLTLLVTTFYVSQSVYFILIKRLSDVFSILNSWGSPMAFNCAHKSLDWRLVLLQRDNQVVLVSV